VKAATLKKVVMFLKLYKKLNTRDLKAIQHPTLGAEAMATLINSKKPDVFRWHDSGDVQDVDHLEKIFEVCRANTYEASLDAHT
jgi:hypothetical protein